MTVRDDINLIGRPNLESLIGSRGESEAFRFRVQEMARSGDLALLGILLDRFVKAHAEAILSDLPTETCSLERGAVTGLRNFWWTLLRLGDPDLDGQVPTTEMNPFTTFSDLEKP